MVKIALDAMGGDHAPSVVIEGAVDAVKSNQGRYAVVLTGPKDIIEEELSKHEYPSELIEIFDAPQIVAMDESPAVVLKTKPDSGLVTCVGLQKKGVVQASVSAGNSGAMMAACLMILGRIGRISRPSITCVTPSLSGGTVVLDCGANVDEKASTLVDFAICGSAYAEHILKRDNPKVGLLNVGEEEKKGGEVIQEAHQLLKGAPINFIGNIEGRDIILGGPDVVVTPGYTGNVVLKLMEGFYTFHNKYFGKSDLPEAKKFDEEWDYDKIGGAVLLGLKGTGIIAHGRANAEAIKSSLETSYQFTQVDLASKIEEKLGLNE